MASKEATNARATASKALALLEVAEKALALAKSKETNSASSTAAETLAGAPALMQSELPSPCSSDYTRKEIPIRKYC